MNWPPVLFIGIILPGFSFSAQPPLRDAEATRRRVETLYRQFVELMKSTPTETCDLDCTLENRRVAMNRVAEAIHHEVDGYVERAIRPARSTGPDGSSVTIRAYTPARTRFRRKAVADNDMAGYAVHTVVQLPSPTKDELFLLLSGGMMGANGPNTRMRTHAYARTRFRTVWMPGNIWGNFTIHPTKHGFRIKGDYYQTNKRRNDHYSLTEDAVYAEID